MKKLLLSVYLLSIAAFYGYSQNLNLFTPQGTDVTNASITQVGTKDSLELITYLHVKNTGAQQINVFCRKIEHTMLDSAELYMCWAGGCFTSGTYVSPSAAPIAAGQTLTDFSGHYSMTTGLGFKSGESLVTWVFFSEANHNDSAYVTVKYSTYPLGLAEKNSQGTLSAIWPNPANASASFTCSVQTGAQGEIVIRNLVGATVYAEAVSAGTSKMTVNTSMLGDGIYFCSLLVDGKASQTKKLVVKH